MGRPKTKHFLPYEEAKSYVRRNAPHVTNRAQYMRWWMEVEPMFLPKWPHRVWGRERGMFSWNDFLGNTNSFEKTRNRLDKVNPEDRYRPIWEAVRWAQKFAKEHNLHSEREWKELQRENNDLFPKDIPKMPERTYPHFPGWPVWLGKDIQSQLETQKNVVAVIALHHVKGEPPNVVNTKIWKDGYTSLVTNIDGEQVLGKVYQVWHYEPELFQQVDMIMRKNGRQHDGHWIIANVNQLMWDLSEVLLIYRPST